MVFSHWKYIPTNSRYLDVKKINQGGCSLSFCGAYLHPVAHIDLPRASRAFVSSCPSGPINVMFCGIPKHIVNGVQ